LKRTLEDKVKLLNSTKKGKKVYNEIIIKEKKRKNNNNNNNNKIYFINILYKNKKKIIKLF
jgi:hypothetical protein